MTVVDSVGHGAGLIFVSHRKADRDFVKERLAEIEGRGFRQIRFTSQPEKSVAIGDPWEQALWENLSASQVVLFFLTPSSLESNWCFAELALARALGKPTLTLRRDAEDLLHPLTQHLQAEDLDDPGWLERVCGWLSRYVSPQTASWPRRECPYPGLRAFSRRFEPVFFGREEAVAVLLEVFAPLHHTRRTRRVVAVTGPSGSGKSSLVRAGLIGPLDRRPGWTVLPPLVPGRDPLRRLASCVLEARSIEADESEMARVASSLERGSKEELTPLLEQVHPDLTHPPQVVIVVDQFEELATTTPASAAADFLATLDTLARGELGVWLLLTVRSEFAARDDGCPVTDFLAADRLTYMLLPPSPDRETLSRIIEKPANLAGVSVEPAVVDRVLEEMGETGTRGAALPLLAFALELAWKGREVRIGDETKSRKFTLDDYLGTGGLRQVVADRARLVRRQLALQGLEKRLLPTLARFVVPMSVGERPVRRRVEVEDLDADAQGVLRALEAERLVRVVRDEERAAFDVTHESVFGAWDELREYLEANQQALLDRDEVKRRARTWEEEGRAEDDLLRGALLQRVTESGSRDDGLVAEFLERSLAADQESQVVAVRERAKRLAGEALAELDLAPLESLGRVVEAGVACREAGITPPEPLQEALYAAVSRARQTTSFAAHSAAVRGVAVAPDGRLATGGEDHLVLLWEPAESKPRRLGNHRSGVTALTFGAAGRFLASAEEGHRLLCWSLEEVRKPVVQDVAGSAVIAMDDAGDGRHVVCLGESGELSLRELPALAPAAKTVVHDGAGCACVVNPSSGQVLTGGADGRLESRRISDLKLVDRVEAHTMPISALAVAHGGGSIATGALDGTVRVWNADLTPLSPVLAAHGGWVSALRFGSDDRTVYSAGFDGVIRQWRLDGEPAEHALVGHLGPVSALALNRRTGRLVSGGADATLRTWLARGRRLGEAGRSFAEPVNAVAFLGQERILVTADRRLTVLSRRDGSVLDTWEGHADYVWALAVSPDGHTIASASADSTVRLWDETGQHLGSPLADHEDDVIAIAFTTDGNEVLSAGSDGAIRLWRREDGKLLNAALGRHDGQINAVCCFEGEDGAIVVSGGGDGCVRIWDLEGRRVARCDAHEGDARSLAVAEDGQKVFSGGEDGRIRAWSSDLTQSVAEVRAHQGTVRDLIAMPDGGLYSSGDDGRVKRWTSGLEPLLEPLQTSEAGATALDLGADGEELVTGANDGAVRWWRAGTWETWLCECEERLASRGADRLISTGSRGSDSPLD